MEKPISVHLHPVADPDPLFWEQYARLWQNSMGRSPFQAPQILQYFAGRWDKPVVCFQYFRGDELLAAAVFKQDNGTYSFLSDMKTDANFFVLHHECAAEDLRHIFEAFLGAVKQTGWSLMLNHQPAWAAYMGALEAAGQASGLYWQNIPYSVCPVVDEVSAQTLFDRINGSRELRYRVSKLKNQEKADFEIFTDGTDLDHWVDEFCVAHVLRWSNTPTPSSYRDPLRRQFLKGSLEAWNEAGILRRFSVRVNGNRIGFVIGLMEENSLIHHATTFHPEFSKYSPGKALIHVMAEWMLRQNIRVLDFGDGNEAYKYTVANKEHALHRIFISRPLNLPFIFKTKAIKTVRNNPVIFNFYRDKIKPIHKRMLK